MGWKEGFGHPDESGGLVSDVTLTVRKAKFGYTDEYLKGEACVFQFAEVDVEEIDVPQEEGWRPFWSMGKGWEPAEGGKTARHETRSVIHSSSNAGMVFAAVFGTKANPKGMLYEGEPVGRLMVEHTEVENPMDAGIWAGSRWRLERVPTPESEEFRRDREERQRAADKPLRPPTTLVPVEFLGFTNDKASGKKAGKKAGWDAEGFLAEVDAPVRKELRKAARKSDSADEFGDLAGEIEALGEDDDLKATVLGHLGEIRDALVE